MPFTNFFSFPAASMQFETQMSSPVLLIVLQVYTSLKQRFTVFFAVNAAYDLAPSKTSQCDKA
jgi:hypothetical protein